MTRTIWPSWPSGSRLSRRGTGEEKKSGRAAYANAVSDDHLRVAIIAVLADGTAVFPSLHVNQRKNIARAGINIAQRLMGLRRCRSHSSLRCAEFSKASLSGQDLTNHWIVPSGRHTYTTEITPQLNLPFDTTIHYATIHVHPFARGLQLRDLTTDATVFRLSSQDWSNRIGVAHVDKFKSTNGLPICRDHRYKLTTEYDNPSGSTTAGMAILYLYLLEKI